jgi:hypothetical protein
MAWESRRPLRVRVVGAHLRFPWRKHMGQEDSKESGNAKKEKKPLKDSTRMAAAVAVTATIFSPTVRAVLHRGAVRGLAGVLVLGDAMGSFARGVGRGIRDANASPANPLQDGTAQSAASAVEAARDAARAAQEAARAAQEAAEAARSAAGGPGIPPKPRKPRTPRKDREEGRENPDE